MSQCEPERMGIGLVGVGRHGRRYLSHILTDVPGASLAAVCRRRIEQPDPSLPTVPVYGDYREMMADSRVQAVTVVTVPSLCHDICLAAVHAGKPVLIEKPLATTGKEARAMVAAAESERVLLMTAHTMRFDPAILLVKELLPSLGRLREAAFTSHIESSASLMDRTAREASPGAMLELGVHLLDLVRFLTGEEALEVSCTMDRLKGAGERAARARLQTAGGIVCALDIARTDSGRIGTMQWNGAEGTVTADWIQRRVVRQRRGESPRTWMVEATPTIVGVLRSFVHAIKTGTTPPVTGLDGCRAVELVDACYESAEAGGVSVRLNPV
ncbi:MAG TPA: Gfo/Idh/MocA family oxidoreductase [Nitrospira sp.]|nr:Gfo/Idh/MocA family oxidoreductase [Nitrospira sp.]